LPHRACGIAKPLARNRFGNEDCVNVCLLCVVCRESPAPARSNAEHVDQSDSHISGRHQLGLTTTDEEDRLVEMSVYARKQIGLFPPLIQYCGGREAAP
jgi:hypothetical protein